MSCPFYGNSAVSTFGLVETGGNQCGVIVRSFAPCMMEVSLGLAPDASTCELLRSAALLAEFYAMHARRAQAAFAKPEEPV